MPRKNPASRKRRKSARSIRNRCLNDPAFRAQATRENHALFFAVYLHSHLEYPIAPFHREIFKWTQGRHFELIVVAAFRGAGKSTICTVSLPLWMVLGKLEKKYVIIVARTQEQARRLIANIIKEIEENSLLRRDLGPLQYDKDEQRRFSIELGKYKALIQAVSLDQSIRGLKYGSRRPDAIICDDLEDSDAARTQEGRDAVFRRFTGEILPMRDTERADVVVVGNTVHQEGLILRLGKQIIDGERPGKFGRYPIADGGMPLWPGKFKDIAAVEGERAKIGDEAMWRREYLLDPRSGLESIVKEEWLQTWHTLPDSESRRQSAVVMGVDLAFSTGPHSDCTAVVPAKVFWTGEDFEIYVLPEIVNARLEPMQSQEKVVSLAKGLSAGEPRTVSIFTEDFGAQRLYIEQWQREDCQAEGIPLRGMSKEDRMAIAAPYIQRGKILFPAQGAELLKSQIVGLGIERHDDLADALTVLLLGVREMSPPPLFSIGELNGLDEDKGWPKHSADDAWFWKPDHSSDRDGGRGEDILGMEF